MLGTPKITNDNLCLENLPYIFDDTEFDQIFAQNYYIHVKKQSDMKSKYNEIKIINSLILPYINAYFKWNACGNTNNFTFEIDTTDVKFINENNHILFILIFVEKVKLWNHIYGLNL
jgi:hypothetical protein